MTSHLLHGKITHMKSFPLLTSLSQNAKPIPLYLLGIWVLYLILSPFYIFPKGTPQPADVILMLGMIPVLFSIFMKGDREKVSIIYIMGGLFVLLTIVVNLVNYLFYPHMRLFMAALIYTFDFAIFIFVVWLFQRDPARVIKYTFWGIVTTILIQLNVLFLFDFGFRGYRGTAGFENPNQLAYWALLTATMLIFLRRGQKIRWQEWILLGLLGFIQTLALSKAGLIAYSVLIILLFITPKVTKMAYLVLAAFILLGVTYAISKPDTFHRIYESIDPLQHAIDRVESIGEEADDNPEARGYYRIIQYPLYTLFGAGEGSFDRFAMKGYDRELHSGIGTMIFSYGIFGAFLFGSFLLLIIYKQPWYYILLFAPIILFGLPHQNFRFAHFWALLGINYGLFLAYYKQQLQDKYLAYKQGLKA